MDSQGRLFVGDRNNNRIQIFDQDGKFLDQWTQFSRPSGIYIDKNDVIYVADSESESVSKNHDGWKRGIRVGSAKDGTVTAFIPDPVEKTTTAPAPPKASRPMRRATSTAPKWRAQAADEVREELDDVKFMRETDMISRRIANEDLICLALRPSLVTAVATAQRAHAQAADPNSAPNPYTMEENWAKLPDGRKMGCADRRRNRSRRQERLGVRPLRRQRLRRLEASRRS